MTTTSRRNQGWRDYWKDGRGASCMPDNPATARDLSKHWESQFADLAEGSRILDVATGNGVLLAHAATAAARAGKTFSLTGIDLANIDPLRHVPDFADSLRGARFIGGVAAEKLPLPDAGFELVISQYGLEYAHLDAALAEVERVLVAGGRLIWLAHCSDSLIVSQNQESAAQVDFLLADGSPLYVMHQFVARVKKGRGLQRTTENLRVSLTEAEAFCRTHPPANVVQEVCTTIAETAQRWQAYRASDLESMLNDSQTRLIRFRQRINDLSAAVLTPARIDLLRSRLCKPQWDRVGISPLQVGATANTLGLHITASRLADEQ
jgi:ubiquinone/menaquinone biosynthesis C-methylase UbiE